MARAKYACPSDVKAQQICGLCQAAAENQCRMEDLIRNKGSNLVTPLWY